MPEKIKAINLALPYRTGTVNCYLIETGAGYILIDTGCPNSQSVLEKELENMGCKHGNLKIIVLTHGDFDHTGNALYLRDKFDAKIAMHHDDTGMVESGNMFWNRKKKSTFLRLIAPRLFEFGKTKRFKPDYYVDEGYDLTEHGYPARIVHIPGHSKGSIGILADNGDLICGDLLENRDRPQLNSVIIDDVAAADSSIAKLKELDIKTVYPGHGNPFPMDAFTGNSRRTGKPLMQVRRPEALAAGSWPDGQ